MKKKIYYLSLILLSSTIYSQTLFAENISNSEQSSDINSAQTINSSVEASTSKEDSEQSNELLDSSPIIMGLSSNSIWKSEDLTENNKINFSDFDSIKFELSEDYANDSSIKYKFNTDDAVWSKEYKNGESFEINHSQIKSINIDLEGRISDNYVLMYRISENGKTFSPWYLNGRETDEQNINYLEISLKSKPKETLQSTAETTENKRSTNNKDNQNADAINSPKVTQVKVATSAMYRLYNPNSGEHFYTANSQEASNLINYGWGYEGIGWNAPQSGEAVYRLYNKNSGDHHYTTSLGEKNNLVFYGWSYEGIGWYSDQGKEIEVLRAYNPNAKSGSHNFTVSQGEQNNLIRVGWRNEGIGWYASSIKSTSNQDSSLKNQYEKKKADDERKKKEAEQRKREEEERRKREVNDRLAKKPVYFSQLDSRWRNVYVGNYTLGQTGCVPTSLAMVLRGSYGQNVMPFDVARTMNSIGSLNKSYYGASATDLAKTVRYYGKTIRVINSNSDMNYYLSQGYPVILFQNVGIGHAVVAHGYSNGSTYIYDPYGQQFYAGWYSTSYLWQYPSNDPIDWSEGTPRFVIM